jgi:hypothetical protein
MPAGSDPGTRWGPEGSGIIRSDIDKIKTLYCITPGPANDYTHPVYNLTYDPGADAAALDAREHRDERDGHLATPALTPAPG